MTMIEALEWAADYCERNNLFISPKNDRGYVEAGWKPPTNAERVEIIRKLAVDVCTAGTDKSPLVEMATILERANQDILEGIRTDSPGLIINAGASIAQQAEILRSVGSG